MGKLFSDTKYEIFWMRPERESQLKSCLDTAGYFSFDLLCKLQLAGDIWHVSLQLRLPPASNDLFLLLKYLQCILQLIAEFDDKQWDLVRQFQGNETSLDQISKYL